jgi:hypothetical protein
LLYYKTEMLQKKSAKLGLFESLKDVAPPSDSRVRLATFSSVEIVAQSITNASRREKLKTISVRRRKDGVSLILETPG